MQINAIFISSIETHSSGQSRQVWHDTSLLISLMHPSLCEKSLLRPHNKNSVWFLTQKTLAQQNEPSNVTQRTPTKVLGKTIKDWISKAMAFSTA